MNKTLLKLSIATTLFACTLNYSAAHQITQPNTFPIEQELKRRFRAAHLDFIIEKTSIVRLLANMPVCPEITANVIGVTMSVFNQNTFITPTDTAQQNDRIAYCLLYDQPENLKIVQELLKKSKYSPRK